MSLLPPALTHVRYDEDVGYTQGLAFIVAALLLNVRFVMCAQLTKDARRRGLLCVGPLNELVQSTLALPRGYAGTSVTLVSVRAPTRGDTTVAAHALCSERREKQHVCQSMVHDSLLLQVSRPCR